MKIGKIRQHREYFFQDGSWLELRTGCHLSEGEEFCAPSTGSQRVSPFPRPAQHTGSSASGLGPATGANAGQRNVETRVTDPGLRPGPVTLTPGGFQCPLDLPATLDTDTPSFKSQHAWVSKSGEVLTASLKSSCCPESEAQNDANQSMGQGKPCAFFFAFPTSRISRFHFTYINIQYFSLSALLHSV